MSSNVNDEVEDRYESTIRYGVFKDGLRIRQPYRDQVTKLVLMPAFADPSDPVSWMPYRNASLPVDEKGNHPFSLWITRYYAYQFIGPKGNQGHFFAQGLTDGDKNFIDPVGKLVETARRDYHTYGEITGQGPDGKKSTVKDAYKKVQLSVADELYAVNAVCLNPTREEDAGLSCIYSLRSSMVRSRNKESQDSGLLSKLRLKNRGVEGTVDPADFKSYYYWGDPTDISGMVTMAIEKVNPVKGFPYYDMKPVEANLIRGSRAMLESRSFLEDVFQRDVDPAETIEWLCGAFAEYPALLRKAFESTFPGVASTLKAAGVVSRSRVHQAGVDNDNLPGMGDSGEEELAPSRHASAAARRNDVDDLPAPAGATRSSAPAEDLPPARRAAPPADDLPAPARFAPAPPKSDGAPRTAGVGTNAAIQAEADRIRREVEGQLT